MLNGSFTTPRQGVQYIVTEYSSVNLKGKSKKRVLAMILLVHPKFSEELTTKAKEMNLI